MNDILKENLRRSQLYQISVIKTLSLFAASIREMPNLRECGDSAEEAQKLVTDALESFSTIFARRSEYLPMPLPHVNISCGGGVPQVSDEALMEAYVRELPNLQGLSEHDEGTIALLKEPHVPEPHQTSDILEENLRRVRIYEIKTVEETDRDEDEDAWKASVREIPELQAFSEYDEDAISSLKEELSIAAMEYASAGKYVPEPLEDLDE